MRVLKAILAVSGIFALAAIGFCALQISHTANQARQTLADADAVLKDNSTVLKGISQHADIVVSHVGATVTDLDRTIQIAGGTLNEARRIERDNRADIAAVNKQTLLTLQNVSGLVVSLDGTQRQAGAAITATSASLVPVIQQTHDDLKELQPAIAQMQPLLLRLTDTATNVSNATADVEHEIHKLVYPPPRKWYQKYFLDPLKTAAHLITIPIR